MTYKAEALKITYHGLSKGPLGGWNYTMATLGTFTMEANTLNEVDREVRKRFPKASHVRGYCALQDGRFELGWAGAI